MSVVPSRVVDVGVGLSLAGLGVRHLFFVEGEELFSPVRLTLAALHLTVGSLFLLRRPLRVRASMGQLAAAVPAFLIGGAATSLARPWSAWPLAAEVLFVVGGAAAILSLATLGRCFAILPGGRGVVVRGPYRLVRHPAYASELTMVAGCAVAAGLPWGPLAVLAVPLVVLRILAEERPLSQLEAYAGYRRRTRWRLVPGLW